MSYPDYVIVDVNKVLIYREYDPHQTIFKYLRKFKLHKYQRPIKHINNHTIIFRPYLDQFLEMLKLCKEKIVWSSMTEKNLLPIVAEIENPKYIFFRFDHVLHRVHTTLSSDREKLKDWATTKEIDKLLTYPDFKRWDKHSIIAFDDSKEKYVNNRGNLFYITPYGENGDKQKLFEDEGLLFPIEWLVEREKINKQWTSAL